MQGLREVASIPPERPVQAGREVRDRTAIAAMAWGHTKRQQLPLVLDEERQFEAVEPPQGGLPPCRYAFKDFVRGNPVVVTHSERG